MSSNIKGGKHKMLRSGKNKRLGTFAAQFRRTTNNKIRQLRKRLGFDPVAGEAIKKLMLVSYK